MARGIHFGVQESLIDFPLFRATGDGDRSAVHVHLAVADLVEPSPGQGVFPSVNALGDAVLESAGTAAVGI